MLQNPDDTEMDDPHSDTGVRVAEESDERMLAKLRLQSCTHHTVYVS